MRLLNIVTYSESCANASLKSVFLVSIVVRGGKQISPAPRFSISFLIKQINSLLYLSLYQMHFQFPSTCNIFPNNTLASNSLAKLINCGFTADGYRETLSAPF
jgi:hypothetical protein